MAVEVSRKGASLEFRLRFQVLYHTEDGEDGSAHCHTKPRARFFGKLMVLSIRGPSSWQFELPFGNLVVSSPVLVEFHDSLASIL
jgi:hypothetical protein